MPTKYAVVEVTVDQEWLDLDSGEEDGWQYIVDHFLLNDIPQERYIAFKFVEWRTQEEIENAH